jgi:hypothetical protein
MLSTVEISVEIMAKSELTEAVQKKESKKRRFEKRPTHIPMAMLVSEYTYETGFSKPCRTFPNTPTSAPHTGPKT